jgi:hypothetical protein
MQGEGQRHQTTTKASFWQTWGVLFCILIVIFVCELWYSIRLANLYQRHRVLSTLEIFSFSCSWVFNGSKYSFHFCTTVTNWGLLWLQWLGCWTFLSVMIASRMNNMQMLHRSESAPRLYSGFLTTYWIWARWDAKNSLAIVNSCNNYKDIKTNTNQNVQGCSKSQNVLFLIHFEIGFIGWIWKIGFGRCWVWLGKRTWRTYWHVLCSVH